MTGYSVKLAFHPIQKRIIAIVKFSGDCTIDTTGFTVNDAQLNVLRVAADEYNTVSDTQYPAGATGAEIRRIDEMIEEKSTNVRVLANKLAQLASR